MNLHGQVVSELAFYIDDLSSNPAIFRWKLLEKKNWSGLAHFLNTP